MSEKEMNAYRLTSMEEPTDEILSTLMKEVAADAKHKGQIATDELFKQVNEMTALRKKEWAQRIKHLAK